MPKESIPAGTTSKRIPLFIQDSSSTTGAGLSGLAFNTSGLKCYSWIDTDGNVAATAQTLATATLGTWTTIGFVEKDATNMKGAYEFGIPNALIAAGVKWCFLYFYGATNMAPLVLEIEVTAFSNQVATQKVDVDTIKTNPVVNAGTITFPTTATLASTTNITAATGVDATKWAGGTIPSPTVTGVPNVNVKTINDVATTPVTTVKAVQGLTTADTIATYTGNTKQTGDVFAALPANFSSFVIDATGRVNAFMIGILTSVFTEGAVGRIAAAFKQFFNIGTPAATMDHGILVDTVTTYTGNTPQTGDAFARLGALVLDSGTAQTGVGVTIQLRAGAPDLGANPKNMAVVITGGTGINQIREIGSYNNATKTVTINSTWATTPDNTSTYAVVLMSNLDAQGFPAHFSSLGIDSSGNILVVAETVLCDEVTVCDALTTNNDKTGYALGSNGLDSGALTAAAKNAIADGMLDRNMATGVDSGTDLTVRTPRQALRVLRNKNAIAAGTQTVYKEDDTTTDHTLTVATTAGNPISSVTPV